MFSIILIVFCLSAKIISQSDVPNPDSSTETLIPPTSDPTVAPIGATEEEICADPKFDAGLTVDEASTSRTTRRYLFRGQHVMRYNFYSVPKTIDWSTVTLITNIFKSIPSPDSVRNGVKMAFENDTQVYLILRDSETEYLRFIKEGDDFLYSDQGAINALPFVFLHWKVHTEDEFGSTEHSHYFIDSPPQPSKTQLTSFERPTSVGKFSFSISSKRSKDIAFHDETFPNIFTYKDVRIPTQFDGFYKTQLSEIIFFRGHSACVSSKFSPTIWEDYEYCRSFVDTRTIIGCTSDAVDEGSRPEVNPDEQ